MTKISVAVIAGSALAATVGASAGRASIMELPKSHQPATEALLKKATPYNKKKLTGAASAPAAQSHRNRRLDGEFEVDGTYNLKFSQCVDVKLLDNDLFDEDVIEYTQAGQIISAQSYALFHVCQTDDCYYESEDDLYLVDLATYVKNVASYHASVQSNYCAACDDYYDGYCNVQADDAAAAGDDAVADADDAAGDDAAAYYNGDDANGGRRKLVMKQNERRATSYIDCDQCEAYGCINDDDARDADDDGVLELIEDISGCLNTGLNWNDNDLYVGFMCSPYGGDGVELAIFLDNSCTVYTNLKAFSDIPSWYIYNDEDMFAEAETYIKNAFSETTPCLEEAFGDPAYENNGGDDDANAAANDDGYEVNDYCGNIFAEGAITFNNCGQNDDQNNNNQDENNDNDDNYKWYSYDLDYDDARDLGEVCLVLQQMEGEYEYHYDEDYSGTWNDHSGWGGGSISKKSKGRWGFLGGRSTNGRSNFASSGIMITFYVMLGVAIAIGVLFVVGVHEKNKRVRVEPVYQGGRLV